MLYKLSTNGARRSPLLPRLIGALIMLALAWVAPLRATTVVPPDFSTLVNDSDYIVHATVKNVTAEKQTGDYGTRIMTHVELTIIEVVAGHPPATLTLDLLGGQVGKERMRVVGMPQFAVGEEHILFVSGNGTNFCPLNRMRHGQYPVLTDAATGRKYVARADRTPLQQAADVQRPLGEKQATALAPTANATSGAMGPADFIQQIKAAVQPGGRLERAP